MKISPLSQPPVLGYAAVPGNQLSGKRPSSTPIS